MKKLYSLLLGLFAVVLATYAEVPKIKMCEGVYLRSAQGEQIDGSLYNSMIAQGHTASKLWYRNILFVKDLSQITKNEFGSIDYGDESNYHKFIKKSGSNTYNSSKFPADLYICVYMPNPNVQTYEVKEVSIYYTGFTVERVDDFYVVVDDASDDNKTAGYDLEAYPVRVETYNSFRYLDYPSIVDTRNLPSLEIPDMFDMNASLQEDVYLMKNIGTDHAPNYRIAGLRRDCTNLTNFPTYYGDFDNPVSLYSAFSVPALTKGQSIALLKHNNEWCLADRDLNSVCVIYDVSQGDGTNYSLSYITKTHLEEDGISSHAALLTVIPKDDGTCVIKASYNSNEQNRYIYLDYNESSFSFKLVGTTIEDDAAHKLFLYYACLREDNTPYFQPYNGQVTAFNGGQEGTDFADETDPLLIEMTFDRPLKTDNDNNVLDKDGNILKSSPYFQIEIDGEVVADEEESPQASPELPLNGELEEEGLMYVTEQTTQNQTPKTQKSIVIEKARPTLISSTTIKPGTTNVAQVQLNQAYFTTTTDDAAQAAPAQTGESLKKVIEKARPTLVSSTTIKVVAKAGAIAYADATMSEPVSAPKKVMQRAASLSEEMATTAFAFAYTINANDEISDGGRLNVSVGADGVATYYASENDALNVSSTDQLKFYKVYSLGNGEVKLRRLHGVVYGPMMVQGKPNRTVTVDKGDNANNIEENYLRLCRDGRAQGMIPYYFDGKINSNYEDYDDYRTYILDVGGTPKAYNYLFGKLNGGPLGFYYLNFSSQNGWQNPYDFDFVYLHSYKNLASTQPEAAQRIRLVFENGEEITTQATGIYNVNYDYRKAAPCGRTYNVMGQQVGSDYSGIVVKEGKKLIRQ